MAKEKPDEMLPHLELPVQPPIEPIVAQLTRWRADTPPAQCTFDQLTFAVPIPLEEILGLSARQA
jgi:hypothetical protein